MKWLILILAYSCSQTSTLTSKRLPAQAEGYTACHEIDEEVLIEKVDLRTLPRTFENVKEHVFKNNCIACHFGPDAYKPRLDDYDSTLAYVNRENPEASRLLQTVSEGRMPPSYRLQSRNPEAFRFLREWVQEGAAP